LQVRGERGELRVALVQHRQTLALERMLFDRHEMQPPRAQTIGAPRVPGRKKIQPQAETGLDDGIDTRSGPARGKLVAAEEYVPRLAGTGIGAVIDITVFG